MGDDDNSPGICPFIGGSEAEHEAGFLGRQNGKMIWHHEGET